MRHIARFLLVSTLVAVACGGAGPAAQPPAPAPGSAAKPAAPAAQPPAAAPAQAPAAAPAQASPAAGAPAKPASGSTAPLKAPEKTYELKLAGIMPASHYTQKALQMMADSIQKNSDGKIKVTTYLGGSLLKDKEEVEGIRSGAVDIASHTYSNWNSFVPASEVWDVPYLFPGGYEQQVRLLDQVREIVSSDMEQKGNAKLLSFLANGNVGSVGNNVREIVKPADLNGLKMRAFSRRAAIWQESLGSSPVVISSAEIYTAVQRGTIDGAMTAITSFTTRKIMEVVKHITYAERMANIFFSVAISKKKWDSMEPAAQEIVQAAALEAQKWTVAESQNEDKKALEELGKRSNLKLIILTPEQEKEWVPTGKVALEGFAKDSGETGKKLLDLIQKDSTR